MVTRVFPRFKRSCLYFEYPLTPRKNFSFLDWLLLLPRFSFHNTDTKRKQISQEIEFFTCCTRVDLTD